MTTESSAPADWPTSEVLMRSPICLVISDGNDGDAEPPDPPDGDGDDRRHDARHRRASGIFSPWPGPARLSTGAHVPSSVTIPPEPSTGIGPTGSLEPAAAPCSVPSKRWNERRALSPVSPVM